MTLRKFALCTMLASGLFLSTGFTSQTRNITIDVDGRDVVVSTRYSDPALILHQAGVEMGQKDAFQVKKTEKEERIVVYRSVPIRIEFEGDTQTVYTTRRSVGEVLEDYGYVGENFQSEVPLEAKPYEGLHILIHDLAAEKRRAEELERRTNHIETSRGAMRYTEAYSMEATAYIPSDGGGSGITATGVPAQRGIVAVDPQVIPLGSRVYIPGYGHAIAADTGGAIRGAKIDLCMESYDEAIQFGRRSVEVYVLD